jgi:hypothetical protein
MLGSRREGRGGNLRTCTRAIAPSARFGAIMGMLERCGSAVDRALYHFPMTVTHRPNRADRLT